MTELNWKPVELSWKTIEPDWRTSELCWKNNSYLGNSVGDVEEDFGGFSLNGFAKWQYENVPTQVRGVKLETYQQKM
jgi:hypothetical protein